MPLPNTMNSKTKLKIGKGLRIVGGILVGLNGLDIVTSGGIPAKLAVIGFMAGLAIIAIGYEVFAEKI